MPRSDSAPHDLPATALDRPLAESARLILLARLAAFETARERLQNTKPSSERLHELRVALRRLRTLLRAYEASLDDLTPKKLRKRLTALARATGPARDADVHLAWLDGQDALLPPEIRPFVEHVRTRLEKDQRHGTRQLTRLLDADLRPMLGQLRRRGGEFSLTYRLGAPLDPPRARAELRPILGDLAAVLERRLRAIETVDDETKLHRARIATKRLRYALEPWANAALDGTRHVVSEMQQVLAALEELQARLGEIHDAQALCRRLTEIATEAAAAAAHAAVDAPDLQSAADDPPGDASEGAGSREPELESVPDPRAPALTAAVLERSLRARAAALFADVRLRWLGDRAAAIPDRVRQLANDLAHPGTATARRSSAGP